MIDQFLSLAPDERRVVHEVLVELALARWKAYAAGQGVIRYREMVCGTEQIVDASLPEDALMAVRSGQGIAAVDQRYGEPMAAMHDEDLSFRESAEFAYYAIYNFFQRYGMQREIDDWLIVNQALSSEEDEGKWKGQLTKAMKKARARA